MYPRAKRLFDLAGAVFGILVAAPFAPLIAFVTVASMGFPILFRQRRPGLREQIFTCYKFRTMTATRNANGDLLSDAERLTAFGSFLRATSLDELPQLWNILRGDLSFVGPRPLFESYLAYYTEIERKRHSVRPGLTGWAQIHGRNLLNFDERLAMDVWYVDHVSWSLDLRILLRTVRLVLSREGVTPSSDQPFVPLDVQRQERMLNPPHAADPRRDA